MTLTVAAALLVSPSVGLLAAELRDPNAEQARIAVEAEQALRDDWVDHGLAAAPHESAAAVRLAALGIEVFTPERPFRLPSGRAWLAGQPISEQDRERVLATSADELARYPAQFLARARLRRLLLCARLQEGSEPIPSLPNYHGAMLLDVDADAPYLRRLIHHEVFHFADFADDEQLSLDPAWLLLNEPDFAYGSGGRFMRTPGVGRFSAEIPGFVSRYATSALEEDKAETFAMRMSEPTKFAKLIASDAVLRAKSAALDAQLRKLSPAFASIDQP
ncbi:MAG TPA: hypothetical protein VFK05_20340 [Polyangiaceae bacterium]|nr:hypothetical protein [Polyangiaceae bacterium]